MKKKIAIIAAAVIVVLAAVIGVGAMSGWFSGNKGWKFTAFHGKTELYAQTWQTISSLYQSSRKKAY